MNSRRYTDGATLVVESEQETKEPLMRVKEESENAGLKLSICETKIMASDPISQRQIKGE